MIPNGFGMGRKNLLLSTLSWPQVGEFCDDPIEVNAASTTIIHVKENSILSRCSLLYPCTLVGKKKDGTTIVDR